MKVVGGVILAGVASAQDFSYIVAVSDGCDDSGCADGIATTGVFDPADVKTCIDSLAPECGYDVTATFEGTDLTLDADVCPSGTTKFFKVFKFPTELDHGLDLPEWSIEATDLSFDFGTPATAACTLKSYTTWQDSDPDCANDLEQVEPVPPAAPWEVTAAKSTPMVFKESLTSNANYLVFEGDTTTCPDIATLTSPTKATVASYVVTAHKDATTVTPPDSTDLVAPPDSTDLVAPPDSTDLVAPGDSTDLVAPGDSSKPVAPGGTSKPVAPGDSTVLVAPGDSTVLVAPGDSTVLVAPGDSSKPVAPGDTTESVGAYAGLTTVSLLIAAACLQ